VASTISVSTPSTRTPNSTAALVPWNFSSGM
jgi:hypothetical protein